MTVKPDRLHKPSRAAKRVLRAIESGDSWRATHETVQELLDNGLAHYDDSSVWHIGPRTSENGK